MKRGLFLIFFSLCLFGIDAAAKYWAAGHLTNMSYATPFYPYGGIGIFQDFAGIDFSINLAKNKGGAWGIFSSFPQALVAVRLVIITALFIYASFFNKLRKRDIPFMLILTGATANIIDYFIYGAVIDLFYFVLWGYSYPVFNVADMLIFFGVAILLIQSLIEKVRSHETQPSQN